MNLVNLLFADVVKFLAEKDQDLVFIIKFIDYMFSTSEVNTQQEAEVETFVNNMRILNNLYRLFGLITDYSDKERTAFNDENIIGLLEEPDRIAGYQKFRLGLQNKYNTDLISLYDEYREREF